MKKTLVVVGHPNIENSIFNKAMVENIKDIKSVTVHYAKADINVEQEQKLFLEHDNIVFQYPYQWYGMPGMLKTYLDKVFSYGFAFGTDYKLANKKGMIAITTAGLKEYYQPDGLNKYTIEDLTKNMERTFEYTKMIPQKIFVIHGAKAEEFGGIKQDDFNKKLQEYRATIISL
jgi:glutathione-regulated potassium-efflux system ancillary protein KefG